MPSKDNRNAWAKRRAAAQPTRRHGRREALSRSSAGTVAASRAARPVVTTPQRAQPGAARTDGRVASGRVPEPDELDVDAPRLSPWVWRVALALCLIGLADATYLTIAHYSSAVTLICADHGVVNCAKVTSSPQSVIVGIPVALLGLLYFVGITPLMLPVAWRSVAAWVRWLRLAAVVAGVGMVAYLIYTELFTLKAICLYCTGVHVVTVLLFLTVMVGTALVPRAGETG
jgi:uncharacterized membrane protein